MQASKIFLPFCMATSVWTAMVRFFILVGAIFILAFKPIAVYQYLLLAPFALIIIQKTSNLSNKIICPNQIDHIISFISFIFGNLFIIITMGAALYVLSGLFWSEVY